MCLLSSESAVPIWEQERQSNFWDTLLQMMVSKEIRKAPEIYYVGNSISSTYMKDLMDVIGDRDFSINMISKSGTTTEPAIAFRVFKELLEKKYGKEGAAEENLCDNG